MPRMHVLPIAAWTLLAGCAATAEPEVRAPEPSRSHADAEQVVDAYIQAMSEGDLATCASLMHPKALQTLHDILMPIAEPAEEAGTLDQFLALFSGVDSVEQLAALSKEELFASFVKGALFAQPGIFEVMRSMEHAIIGAVEETDQRVHVVYRMKMQANGAQIDEVELISLERDGDRWRLQLSGDIKGSAERIKRLFSAGVRPAAKE